MSSGVRTQATNDWRLFQPQNIFMSSVKVYPSLALAYDDNTKLRSNAHLSVMSVF